MNDRILPVLVTLVLLSAWGEAQVPAARRLHIVPLNGFTAAVNSGPSVIPDFDGDGIKDLALPGAFINQRKMRIGLVQIVSGQTGAVVWEVRADKATGFGFTIAPLPDMDGDKRPEILIGAPAAYNKQISNAGAVFLYSSRTKKILREHRGSQQYDRYGASMGSLDDLDGDKFDDYYLKSGRMGVYYFYSGRSGKLLRAFTYKKYSLLDPRSVPDLDKDGIRDLVFGASSGHSSPGRLLIISGKTFKLIRTITGYPNGRGFGSSRALIPDVNGDGVDDLIVSDRFYPNPRYYVNGYVRLISLVDGKVLREWKSPMKTLDYFGFSVGHAGDIDQDGVADVLINVSIVNDPIGVRAYSGKTGKLLRTYAAIPGKGKIYGGQYMGDVNGDGVGDVAILSVLNWPGISSVHVFSGQQLGLDANKKSLSLSKQESLEFKINAGPTHKTKFYLLLGSLSGEDPGLQIGSHYLPLIWDPYSIFTLGFANSPFLSRSFFPYTGASSSKSFLKMLPGMPTSLIGLNFHHAFLIWNAKTGGIDFTSNTVKTKILK